MAAQGRFQPVEWGWPAQTQPQPQLQQQQQESHFSKCSTPSYLKRCWLDSDYETTPFGSTSARVVMLKEIHLSDAWNVIMSGRFDNVLSIWSSDGGNDKTLHLQSDLVSSSRPTLKALQLTEEWTLLSVGSLRLWNNFASRFGAKLDNNDDGDARNPVTLKDIQKMLRIDSRSDRFNHLMVMVSNETMFVCCVSITPKNQFSYRFIHSWEVVMYANLCLCESTQGTEVIVVESSEGTVSLLDASSKEFNTDLTTIDFSDCASIRKSFSLLALRRGRVLMVLDQIINLLEVETATKAKVINTCYHDCVSAGEGTVTLIRDSPYVACATNKGIAVMDTSDDVLAFVQWISPRTTVSTMIELRNGSVDGAIEFFRRLDDKYTWLLFFPSLSLLCEAKLTSALMHNKILVSLSDAARG